MTDFATYAVEYSVVGGAALTYYLGSPFSASTRGKAFDLAATVTGKAISAFSTGVWSESAKTITLANQFTNYATGCNLGAALGVSTTYAAFPGDRLIVTGGTGVVAGTYHIVNVITGGTSTGDVLTLAESITGGVGGAPTDVTASSSATVLHQTRNALWLGEGANGGGTAAIGLHKAYPVSALAAASDGIKVTDTAGTVQGNASFTGRVAASIIPIVDAMGFPLLIPAPGANSPIMITTVGTTSWLIHWSRVR